MVPSRGNIGERVRHGGQSLFQMGDVAAEPLMQALLAPQQLFQAGDLLRRPLRVQPVPAARRSMCRRCLVSAYVDDDDVAAGFGRSNGGMDGERGFPAAALLAYECERLHGAITPFPLQG